jgi:two-component system cell cycle response regulator
MKNFSILLVDDEPDLLMSLESAIKSEGYNIITAENGEAALIKAKQHKPSLMLLDVMMPGIDGFEVCRRIKEDNETNSIAVIFLSANNLSASKVQGLDTGGYDYIPKPFSYAEIFARLRSFKREWKYRQEIITLIDFSKAIKPLDFSVLMDTIKEKIGTMYYADRFSIFLWDPRTQHLQLAVSNREFTGETESIHIDTAPFMRDVVKGGEIIYLRNFRESKYYVPKNSVYVDNFAFGIPLKMEKNVIGVLNLNGNSAGFFDDHDLSFMQLGAELIAGAISNSIQYRQVQELAVKDPLTNIYNRRFFFERLHLEWERSKRYNSKMTIMMADVDFFKKINDTYGHECGDMVLVGTAQTLSRHLRKVDVVARYGGEEFILMLPEIPKQAALNVAERIRKDMESTKYKWDDKEFTVTISIGMHDSSSEELKAPEDMIRKADANLYKAKEGGRNRVVTS